MSDEVSATAKYAAEFYNLMDSRAEENQYHERIFTGSLTKLYRELGASTAYYTRIRKVLIESGAIEILVRGNGKQPTQIKLNQNISDQGLTARPPSATVGVEVERRLAALESWRETTGGLNIAEVLRNMESRLSELERKANAESVTGGKD